MLYFAGFSSCTSSDALYTKVYQDIRSNEAFDAVTSNFEP